MPRCSDTQHFRLLLCHLSTGGLEVSPAWVFGRPAGGCTPSDGTTPRRSPRLATLGVSPCKIPEAEQEDVLPAGYLERPVAGAPTFMQRRLAQLNPGTAQPLGSDLRVHQSKLEQAKAEADAKKRAGQAEARRMPASAAAAAAAPLGSDLRVHMSKLEQAKAAAVAAKAAGQASPVVQRRSGATSHAGGGLTDLKVHKSKLELAKEAAVAAAAAGGTPGRGVKRGRGDAGPEGTGLSDMKVHKSGLELAKDAASKLPQTPVGARKAQAQQSRAAARLAADWAAWDGEPMDNLMVKPMSKLEKEVAAWKAAAAKQAKK